MNVGLRVHSPAVAQSSHWRRLASLCAKLSIAAAVTPTKRRERDIPTARVASGAPSAGVPLEAVLAMVVRTTGSKVDADSPLPPGALEGLSPPFDGERELAEAADVETDPTSVDFIRGCVSVAWHRTADAGRYFRVREIADGSIYTARSTPDLEAAKRTKQLFVGL